MNHLFLFTISPVQPFIASARKTRDLYAGSQILSEMTKEAAKEAVNQGLTLVFPKTTDGKSFPNRFMAKMGGEITEENLQAKGEAIKSAAINKFNEFAKEALKKVSIDEKTRDSFWKQIENYWDINWLFYPYESDYKAAYKEIEPLMAALKNQRVIKNDFVEAGRKCSLDGQNNALFRGQGTTNKLLEKQAVEVNNTWLNPNEGLSAISLVKRAYSGGDGFKSTIKVALKERVKKIDKELLSCYEDLFSENYKKACAKLLLSRDILIIDLEKSQEKPWITTFDEEFLVADNLTEKNIPNLTQLEIAREVHRKYLKSALTDRYYALIAFDGDKMGKLLSGELLKDKSADLEEFQGKVSELLMKYSQEIDKSLKDKIDIVYAGGDDFLGFVCLHDLFEVGKKLRAQFGEMVNQELQDDIEGNFTFSMGITIAHYKTPLSIVLQKTHEMEKLAKNEEKGNRDAFAIAVLKHSGESHEAYYKWYEKDDDDEKENMKAWTALEKLVKHLQNDCSDTFIRVLEREFRLLQNKKGEIENTNMLTLELGRLAQRSLNEKGKREKKGREVTENVLKLISVRESKTQKSYANFTNSFEAMKVAMFMKRKSKAFKEENV
jgi:CRISPR-associated protein Cmr2